MARTSRLSPGFYFRRYVCFMASRLPVNNLLMLTLATALIYAFIWGTMPMLKTMANSNEAIKLLSPLIPNPELALTIFYYGGVIAVHLIGSIPLCRILQIYNEDYFDIYRDE